MICTNLHDGEIFDPNGTFFTTNLIQILARKVQERHARNPHNDYSTKRPYITVLSLSTRPDEIRKDWILKKYVERKWAIPMPHDRNNLCVYNMHELKVFAFLKQLNWQPPKNPAPSNPTNTATAPNTPQKQTEGEQVRATSEPPRTTLPRLVLDKPATITFSMFKSKTYADAVTPARGTPPPRPSTTTHGPSSSDDDDEDIYGTPKPRRDPRSINPRRRHRRRMGRVWWW